MTPEQVWLRGGEVTRHVQVRLGAPAGPGWLPYRALSTRDGLREIIGYVHRAAPGASATVAAALFASSVTAGFAAPLTGGLLKERRVAVPDPERTWLRPAYTGIAAIAVDRVTLTVLPADPLADRPEVSTAPDLPGLYDAAVAGYRELLAPMVEQVAAHTRRGRRALWVDAGDRLATYLLLAGRALGDPAAARETADVLLARAEPPIRHRVHWVEFEHRGGPVIWKRRPVCCLIYQAPTWRGQYCATCPLVPESETVRRTREWLG